MLIGVSSVVFSGRVIVNVDRFVSATIVISEFSEALNTYSTVSFNSDD